MLRKIGTRERDIIGVIENQEPALLALLEPAFDRLRQFLLIGLRLSRKVRK
jgi:hypothetical protein